MPGGRPTKLTPEVQKKICDMVSAGNYIETAAAYAGIHKDTLYEWLKRGAKAKSGIHREFSDAVEKALAMSEAGDVLTISQAAKDGVWQAAAWRLERKNPKRWGRRAQIGIGGPDGGPVRVSEESPLDLTQLSTEEAEQLVALLEKAKPAQPDEPGDDE